MAIQWIQKALAGHKKGALHKALGIKPGTLIPPAILMKAMKSSNPKIKKMATLAETLKKMHK